MDSHKPRSLINVLVVVLSCLLCVRGAFAADPPVPVALTVDPQDSWTPRLGAMRRFRIFGHFADAPPREVTDVCTWRVVQQEDFKAIEGTGTPGEYQAVWKGTAIISATMGQGATAVRKRITVVVDADLAAVSLKPAPWLDAEVGHERQFKVEGTYEDGATRVLTGAVRWRLGDPDILEATGTPGKFRARGLGKTTLRAFYGIGRHGFQVETEVSVVFPVVGPPAVAVPPAPAPGPNSPAANPGTKPPAPAPRPEIVADIAVAPEQETYAPGSTLTFTPTITNGRSITACRWYVAGDYVGSGANGVRHRFGETGSYEVRLGLRCGSNFDEISVTRTIVVGNAAVGKLGTWVNRFAAGGAPGNLVVTSSYYRGGTADWSTPIRFNGSSIGAVDQAILHTGKQADGYNTGFLVYCPRGRNEVLFKVFHFRWPENAKLGPPPSGVVHYAGRLPLHGRKPVPGSIRFTRTASRLCEVEWRSEDGSSCRARISKFEKTNHIRFSGIEDLGCTPGVYPPVGTASPTPTVAGASGGGQGGTPVAGAGATTPPNGGQVAAPGGRDDPNGPGKAGTPGAVATSEPIEEPVAVADPGDPADPGLGEPPGDLEQPDDPGAAAQVDGPGADGGAEDGGDAVEEEEDPQTAEGHDQDGQPGADGAGAGAGSGWMTAGTGAGSVSPKAAQWQETGFLVVSGTRRFDTHWYRLTWGEKDPFYAMGEDAKQPPTHTYEEVIGKARITDAKITVRGPGAVAFFVQRKIGPWVRLYDSTTGQRFNPHSGGEQVMYVAKPWHQVDGRWEGEWTGTWSGRVNDLDGRKGMGGWVPAGQTRTFDVVVDPGWYDPGGGRGFSAPSDITYEIWFFPREGGAVKVVQAPRPSGSSTAGAGSRTDPQGPSAAGPTGPAVPAVPIDPAKTPPLRVKMEER